LRQLDKHELCSSDCIGTKRNFVRVSSDENLGSAASRSLKEIVLIMRIRCCTVVYGIMLMLGMGGLAVAQDDGAQKPSAREQLQHIHTPQSIAQKLAQLTKDLELTSKRQQQVRPLLQEHHDKIPVPPDKNPTASRHQLGPQIHAISDETHHKNPRSAYQLLRHASSRA